MAYETLAAAQIAANEMIKEPLSEMYGGVIILRALDGAGYDVAYGTPTMVGHSVYAQSSHHPAEVVEARTWGG
jgi:hypothetical protein